jgi:hypothetical protein
MERRFKKGDRVYVIRDDHSWLKREHTGSFHQYLCEEKEAVEIITSYDDYKDVYVTIWFGYLGTIEDLRKIKIKEFFNGNKE